MTQYRFDGNGSLVIDDTVCSMCRVPVTPGTSVPHDDGGRICAGCQYHLATCTSPYCEAPECERARAAVAS